MTEMDAIRATSEEKLGFALRKLNRKYRKRIAAAAKQHGGVEFIPPAFWAEMQREIENESAAMLILVLIAAHSHSADRLKIEAGTDEVRARMREESQRMAAEYAGKYVENTRERIITDLAKIKIRIDRIRSKIKYPKKQFDREQRASIEKVLSDERAESSAVTETTKGISKGQGGAIDDFKAEHPGAKVEIKWITERDARVCPICAPLDGKNQEIWSRSFPTGPPAHVNCRCELLLNGKIGRLPDLTFP